ncbi:recombinase family protein [Streptacidiphilus anmyonensis]|uniref:recombinase family protein n=1 Tax=Streptacidiphilus anmyonensis TaxID=405782 RepID=UPI0005AA3C74|nr:recombinase family protein [Streptacidiphilus anmyonensis]
MAADDLVQRAHWGDLSGMNIAGLVRLSFELDDALLTAASTPVDSGKAEGRRFVPMNGRDIKGREEQMKDVRQFVEARGGTYIYTYEEPDTSAWKRRRVRLPGGRIAYRVQRPVLEAAFDDLKHGITPDGQRIDGLIVYDIDRLTRDNRNLEDAIEVVENFRRPIIDITGTLDLLTDNGRTVARILVATSNKQSADTARRVKRKHRAMKEAGLTTGGPRPIGWNADKKTLNHSEAEKIRIAARRILEGGSPFTIAAEWNRTGFATPKGNKWTGYTIRYILRNPRICGYSYRSASVFDPLTGAENRRVEVVYDEGGEPILGHWDKILEPETWKDLVAILGENPEPGAGHNARKYLSTGTLRCGKNDCGAPLRATKAPNRAKKPAGFFYYVCPSKSSGKGCGGITIDGPETDKAVKNLVIAKYELEAQRRKAILKPQRWAHEEELARLQEDIADWKEQRSARLVSKEAFFEFIAEADAKERALLRDRIKYERRTRGAVEQPIDLRAIWDDLSLTEKRGYIEATLTAIVVASAVGRGRPVRERLTPLYRHKE